MQQSCEQGVAHLSARHRETAAADAEPTLRKCIAAVSRAAPLSNVSSRVQLQDPSVRAYIRALTSSRARSTGSQSEMCSPRRCDRAPVRCEGELDTELRAFAALADTLCTNIGQCAAAQPPCNASLVQIWRQGLCARDCITLLCFLNQAAKHSQVCGAAYQ